MFLSTVASAEPERPCPACRHGMARAEGQVAGAADYLCRFCEVAVHVRPDGREAVSFRIAGERREFDLVGGARFLFPLPGFQTPEEALVPVDEAALAAAPGAGHPVKVPAAPVRLPGHPVRLPGHPVELQTHPVGLPGAALELPDHPVRLPTHPVTLARHPVRPSAAPFHLSGHPVRLPGHPMGIGGSVVVLSRAPANGGAVQQPVRRAEPETAAAPAAAPQAAAEPARRDAGWAGRARFFGRRASGSFATWKR